MTRQKMIVAIDGPAGSGKSTVARKVADKLGFLYIDTGAMYRAITLKAIRAQIDLTNITALINISNNTKLEMQSCSDGVKVIMDGENVSDYIRSTTLTNKISYIARVPEIRKQLVKLQRELGNKNNSVLEGRDIGTVVFPDAKCKIYLDASVEERAKRRLKDLIKIDGKITLEKVREDVIKRDKCDFNRKVGPLKKARDSIVIDTTNMSIEEVVNKIIKRVKAELKL